LSLEVETLLDEFLRCQRALGTRPHRGPPRWTMPPTLVQPADIGSMTATTPAYDHIGRSYARHRRPDRRIAARIVAALGDSTSVMDVGAGTGSYEPRDRIVVAVEPSWVMIAQRLTRCAARGARERGNAAVRERRLRRRDGPPHRAPLDRLPARA